MMSKIPMLAEEAKDTTTPLILEQIKKLKEVDGGIHDEKYYLDQAERDILGMTSEEAEKAYYEYNYEYNLEYEKQMRAGNYGWY